MPKEALCMIIETGTGEESRAIDAVRRLLSLGLLRCTVGVELHL